MSFGPELRPSNIDPEKSNRLIAEVVMLHRADPSAREHLDPHEAIELRALLLTADCSPKGFPTIERIVEKIKQK